MLVADIWNDSSISQNKGKKCLAHLSYIELIKPPNETQTHPKKIQ